MDTGPNNAKIVAILTAKPGRIDELVALISGLASASRAEPGNLRWDIWRDPASPERFVIDALYVDAAAVDAHRATPHFQNYASKVNTLAERAAHLVAPFDLG